jgi:hypothetical protein
MQQTKTEKLHIRLTEDVARQVRAIADLEHRPIQDQLRFLIVMGLQALRAEVHGNGDASRRTATPDAAERASRPELPMPPIAAKRRTAPLKVSVA